jgi:tRNA-binding EMAP/Myf-like protein
MSSLSQVRVEIIKEIQNHPNADNLSIYILSNGFNCIDKIGLFSLGERIVFVPPDMVAIDREDSRYSFLDKGRVRAKKIRGIISCGLLLKLQNPESTEDSDLSAEYGFEPWEPLTSSGVVMGGSEVKAPIQASKYDIDSIRKYWKIFDPEIVVLEKIDGMNSGFIYNSIDNTFYLKTRTRWLKHDRESGRSKGFGFVTFANEEDAQKALEMDGKEIEGRKIVVNIAKPREERTGGDRRFQNRDRRSY